MKHVSQVAERPNIILLHWHDLGRFLSLYGRPGITSPWLENLASEGVVFEQAFCTAPLCSPSRAALFTGRYSHANGVMGLTHTREGWRYRPGEKTLPMLLREAGYRSFLFGQQHEGKSELLGFDEIHVPAPQCMMKPVTEMFTDFLRHRAAKKHPFFASVGFFEVHRHGDSFPPEIYGDGETDDLPEFLPAGLGVDQEALRRDVYRFHQSIRMADEHVGKILATLREQNLEKNTWIIFTTDHGAPFLRGKSSLYDGGIEVSLVMRWPGRLDAGRRVATPISHVDLVPTILDTLGLSLPANLQGRSRRGLLFGGDDGPEQPIFAEKNYHSEYDPIRCIRTSRFKYIRNFVEKRRFGGPDSQAWKSFAALVESPQPLRPPEELYDLSADPMEWNNLAGQTEYATVLEDLRARLSRWMLETGDYLPERTANPPGPEEFGAFAPAKK